MKYSAQMDCQSEADIDFSSVETTLLPNGFRVIKKDDTSIEFTGRGMNSTKEDPIRGATKISLMAKSGLLHLNANLGGVLFMSLFVCLFPPLLILSLSYFNSSDSGVLNLLWIWLVMGPMIAYWIRQRTVKSLKIMLENTIAYQAKK
ncbi:hypothetical protein [Pseudoalteromonas sp. G4]|uniref:hypothetical protein n=1 Tax=Pseudoalteromonas sp. G4 TaxID=2992761 RepID=UPI00237D8087|nr:hypothetical protein [Pseudoalteromonas sp. G4]MDE3271862.1 hypothetical protein [Pseudoalteromonas sp. G4]